MVLTIEAKETRFAGPEYWSKDIELSFVSSSYAPLPSIYARPGFRELPPCTKATVRQYLG